MNTPDLFGEPTETVTLVTPDGTPVPYPRPKKPPHFNLTNEEVSWARWTWNVVTGCLHACKYCFARPIALADPAHFPVGFQPIFHPERLNAPRNTPFPIEKAKLDPRWQRVFVACMGDLFGQWVPDEWIEQVLTSCRRSPQWQYLFLTKFPGRYVGLELPATAWIGTSVDEQKRVRLAEAAFRQIKDVRVKWLSLEPLLAPLEFTDLSMFDWVVIGAQSATMQPDDKGGRKHVPEFQPPKAWVDRLVEQARAAGAGVYLKPNLRGMKLIHEAPRGMAGAAP